MKFTSKTVRTAIGATGIAAVSIFAAATAVAAPPTTGGFGTSEQLVDGLLITDYTVSESGGAASITIRRTSGSAGPVTVEFRTADLPPGPGPLWDRLAPMRLHERTKKTILFVTQDLDEAVLISDGIVIMREGRIQEILQVPLPRPRSDLGVARGTKEFADTRYHVWKALHDAAPGSPTVH